MFIRWGKRFIISLSDEITIDYNSIRFINMVIIYKLLEMCSAKGKSGNVFCKREIRKCVLRKGNQEMCSVKGKSGNGFCEREIRKWVLRKGNQEIIIMMKGMGDDEYQMFNIMLCLVYFSSHAGSLIHDQKL